MPMRVRRPHLPPRACEINQGPDRYVLVTPSRPECHAIAVSPIASCHGRRRHVVLEVWRHARRYWPLRLTLNPDWACALAAADTISAAVALGRARKDAFQASAAR